MPHAAAGLAQQGLHPPGREAFATALLSKASDSSPVRLEQGVTTRLLRTTLLGRPTVGGNNALLRCCSTALLALLSLLMVGWAPSGRPRSLGSEPPPRRRRRRRGQRQGVPPGEQPLNAMLSGRLARRL